MEKQFNPIDPMRNRHQVVREAAILTIDVCSVYTGALRPPDSLSLSLSLAMLCILTFLRSSLGGKNISNFSMFENT